MATRNGSAQWNGNLKEGSGKVTVGEGAWTGDYSFASRFEEGEGHESGGADRGPHIAACFSMALSGQLTEAGHAAEFRSNHRAGATPQRGRQADDRRDHPADRRATCRASTRPAFEQQAAEAKAGCPVSRALAGREHHRG